MMKFVLTLWLTRNFQADKTNPLVKFALDQIRYPRYDCVGWELRWLEVAHTLTTGHTPMYTSLQIRAIRWLKLAYENDPLNSSVVSWLKCNSFEARFDKELHDQYQTLWQTIECVHAAVAESSSFSASG